jgi:hypothetical protein
MIAQLETRTTAGGVILLFLSSFGRARGSRGLPHQRGAPF